MPEVRAAIDALDERLIEMLAIRFGYMRAAARIKPQRSEVRDEVRKAQVIANARQRAEAHGLPGEDIGRMWDTLVEASIAYELAHWDRKSAS